MRLPAVRLPAPSRAVSLMLALIFFLARSARLIAFRAAFGTKKSDEDEGEDEKGEENGDAENGDADNGDADNGDEKSDED